jgi:hypothetical protein
LLTMFQCVVSITFLITCARVKFVLIHEYWWRLELCFIRLENLVKNLYVWKYVRCLVLVTSTNSNDPSYVPLFPGLLNRQMNCNKSIIAFSANETTISRVSVSQVTYVDLQVNISSDVTVLKYYFMFTKNLTL